MQSATLFIYLLKIFILKNVSANKLTSFDEICLSLYFETRSRIFANSIAKLGTRSYTHSLSGSTIVGTSAAELGELSFWMTKSLGPRYSQDG